MPSVSNIAIGANLAAAAGTKARHGMNESIARLSTGIRAMYGADSAGHSVGTTHNAQAKVMLLPQEISKMVFHMLKQVNLFF